MSTQPGSLHAISEGGIAGEHFVTPASPALIAPTISGKEHNTIKLAVIPFACWRAEDVRFEFDSSFLRPEISLELTALKSLIESHTVVGSGIEAGGGVSRPPGLSVFGHADPTGDDEYNKILSGRRAQAVYAALIRDVELWADLFDHPHGRDNWDPKATKIMQAALGRDPNATVNAGARRSLFREYMDLICTERDEAGDLVADASGVPKTLLLKREDFLARGADPKGKGDFQGCGEFNPSLIFSRTEKEGFAPADQKTARDEANAPNRRVVIYLFRPGISISPQDWPCPRAKEGTGACRKRFWSDAASRLANSSERREFAISQDTFACRFYHRLSDHSPCEGNKPTRIGRLFMQVFDGDGRVLLAKRKYKIRRVTSDRVLFSGVLNDEATLLHDFVPDGDYLLKVDRCEEESPMIVQEPTDNVPTVRYLETSALTVFVQTTDGQPIEDATVAVKGLGSLKTDADGVAAFGLVNPGDFEFTATKADHVPVTASTERSALRDLVSLADSANGKVKVGLTKAKPTAQLNAKAPPAVTLKEIRGTLPATKSLQNPPPRIILPDNVLKPSASNSSDPIDHVVLVRHKADVTLEAITDPPGQTVTWELVQNNSTAAKPRFLPDQSGTKLGITLNTPGSFSAVATTKTGSTLRWNFVIVSVEVKDETAKVTTRNLFADAAKQLAAKPNSQFNVPPTHVGAMCGEFIFGQHAWDSELEIKLVGGGPKSDVGVDRVTPRYLQNSETSFIVGEYPLGALGQNAANLSKRRILDAAGFAGSEPGPIVGSAAISPQQNAPIWPVCNVPGMMQVTFPNPADKTTIRMKMGDSPGSGGFEAHLTYPDGKSRDIQKISGFMQFAATVASWSTDAPNSVAIHAAHEWLIDYAGIVKFPNGSNNRAEYAPSGAAVKNVTPWHRIDPANGGAGATEAVMEIFGPLLTSISNQPQVNKF